MKTLMPLSKIWRLKNCSVLWLCPLHGLHSFSREHRAVWFYALLVMAGMSTSLLIRETLSCTPVMWALGCWNRCPRSQGQPWTCFSSFSLTCSFLPGETFQGQSIPARDFGSDHHERLCSLCCVRACSSLSQESHSPRQPHLSCFSPLFLPTH